MRFKRVISSNRHGSTSLSSAVHHSQYFIYNDFSSRQARYIDSFVSTCACLHARSYSSIVLPRATPTADIDAVNGGEVPATTDDITPLTHTHTHVRSRMTGLRDQVEWLMCHQLRGDHLEQATINAMNTTYIVHMYIYINIYIYYIYIYIYV